MAVNNTYGVSSEAMGAISSEVPTNTSKGGVRLLETKFFGETT